MQIASLEQSARQAVLRADAGRNAGQLDVATRFDEAALAFAQQLVHAERDRDDLVRELEHEKSTALPKTTSVFLSYSRHDYYYAETLHAELSKQSHLKPWMDVRNLGLAEDWYASIDAALQSADVLVLVASADSFASKQVEREWRHAIKRGIPVLIVFVRRCKIPDDLSSCPSYDVRGKYKSEVLKLRRDISNLQFDHSAARPAQCAFLYRPPVSIIAVLAILAAELILALLILASWIYIAASSLNPTIHMDASPLGSLRFSYSGTVVYISLLLTAMACATTLGSIRSILAHRLRGRSLLGQQAIFIVAIGGLIAIALRLLQRRSSISDITLPRGIDLLAEWPLLPLIAGGATAVAVIATLLNSMALHRCTRAGYAMNHLRNRVTGGSAGANIDSSGVGFLWRFLRYELINEVTSRQIGQPGDQRSFQIICQPQDHAIGEIIGDACTDVGLTKSTHGYWKIIVVTNISDMARVEQAANRAGAQGICVLASSVSLPPDAEVLRQRQWLDFRVQDIAAMRALLRTVTGHPVRGIAPVPFSPERFRASLTIVTVTDELSIYALVSAGLGIGIISASTQTLGSVFGALLAFAFSASCAWTFVAVGSRRWTVAQYWRASLLNAALFIIGLALAFYIANPGWIVSCFYILALVVYGIRTALAYRRLARWWLLSSPLGGRRSQRIIPRDGMSQSLALAGMVVSLILAATVIPPSELYIHT
ncbi:MAG: toll/interleukin-1 receptor domain-containing protein, partial [Acidobacteria bacterium]|nr:toll/interleukin-1 receptor domain-containing protein [Acidobacteriota bacterium]